MMYRAALTDRSDIEDLRVVSKLIDGLLDSDAFHAALSGGAYLAELRENNRLVWEAYRFPAVPSYHMNGKTLASIENIGVGKQQLASFLDRVK